MKLPPRPHSQTGKCHKCGRPHHLHVHENCGVKKIDDPKKKRQTIKSYRAAKKNYQTGKLPKWMFT